MKTTTEMQLVPISKLVPYVNNARTHSPEQITKLRSSLREFGFINPVIIDRDYRRTMRSFATCCGPVMPGLMNPMSVLTWCIRTGCAPASGGSPALA